MLQLTSKYNTDKHLWKKLSAVIECLCMSVCRCCVTVVYSPTNMMNNPQHHQRLLEWRAQAMTVAHTASLPAFSDPLGTAPAEEKGGEIGKIGKRE